MIRDRKDIFKLTIGIAVIRLVLNIRYIYQLFLLHPICVHILFPSNTTLYLYSKSFHCIYKKCCAPSVTNKRTFRVPTYMVPRSITGTYIYINIGIDTYSYAHLD